MLLIACHKAAELVSVTFKIPVVRLGIVRSEHDDVDLCLDSVCDAVKLFFAVWIIALILQGTSTDSVVQHLIIIA